MGRKRTPARPKGFDELMAAMGTDDVRAVSALYRMLTDGDRKLTAAKVSMLRREYHGLYALPDGDFRRVLRTALLKEEATAGGGQDIELKDNGHTELKNELK